MPVYKLHYFNMRARGETARQLFAYGNIEFEDIRIEWDEWDKIKPKMPFGQMPVLEVDGKMIPQTGAINRLLAKQVGLYSHDDMECADIDVIVDACSEVWTFMPQIYFEEDPVKKAALVKEVTEELLPPYLDRLESYLDEDKVFVVGGRVTLVVRKTTRQTDVCTALLVAFPGTLGFTETMADPVTQEHRWAQVFIKFNIWDVPGLTWNALKLYNMTLADLYLVNDILWTRCHGVTINLDRYPKLKTLEKAVTSEPKIAAWIAKRPVTQV